MTIGKRIKERRKQLGLSADQLGNLIGKNRATIYRYESEEIENMPYDVMLPISKALNVSPTYLMGWEENEPIKTKYPYYDTTVAAGCPTNVEGIVKDDLKSLTIPDEILGRWAGHKDIYLTRINGESMNRVLPNNSLIVVKKMQIEQLKNSDIVVFSHNQEYSVKRMVFLPEENKVIFKPDSTDVRFMDYAVNLNDENLIIHGKVVTYVVELD